MDEKQKKKVIEKIRFYQFDPLGAETWIEDHVCAAITDFKTGATRWTLMRDLPDTPHPLTGRSYRSMWEEQKVNYIRPATARDQHGFLVHATCVACTPRGEGKSFLNCLLILWRFYTQMRQLIILGANSKDQSKFALYDILCDLIRNSPKLLQIIGPENIKEKEIRLRDAAGNIVSKIMAVSAFTGIYSNITAFAFSEIFDMTNPKFFYQLDSSRRNIPNAQGYIDSTVSEIGHVLHNLYEASPLRKNADPSILFFYKFSKEAHFQDYLHPMQTQKQLDSFKAKFTPAEFAKYFKNVWNLDDTAVYDRPLIESMQYIGADGELGQQNVIYSTLKRVHKLRAESTESNGMIDNRSVIDAAMSGLIPAPYKLQDNLQPHPASLVDLHNLSSLYDTQWGLGIGLDLADPLKDDITLGARSMLTLIAKGLPGSASEPDLHLKLKNSGHTPRYIYFLLHLAEIETHEIADVKMIIDLLLGDFGHINTLCVERWGAADLRHFCDENMINLQLISPTYEKQRAAFNPMYTAIKTGYFKAPAVVIPGAREESIIEEEMFAFRHDAVKKWYGSPTKRTKTGIQDDSVFSMAWGFYGLLEVTPDEFESHQGNIFMGSVQQNSDLIGRY